MVRRRNGRNHRPPLPTASGILFPADERWLGRRYSSERRAGVQGTGNPAVKTIRGSGFSRRLARFKVAGPPLSSRA
jgi:hypothetical protein